MGFLRQHHFNAVAAAGCSLNTSIRPPLRSHEPRKSNRAANTDANIYRAVAVIEQNEVTKAEPWHRRITSHGSRTSCR